MQGTVIIHKAKKKKNRQGLFNISWNRLVVRICRRGARKVMTRKDEIKPHRHFSCYVQRNENLEAVSCVEIQIQVQRKSKAG